MKKHLPRTHVSVACKLLRFYASSPSPHQTLLSSDGVTASSSSWKNLIEACAVGDPPRQPALIYRAMRRRGVPPDLFAFPSLLKACAAISALREAQQVRSDILKHGFDSDVYIMNALINLYGSCLRIPDALQVFDEIPERTVVSWNAVISACVHNSRFYDAVEYFIRMICSGFDPDETTMVILLSACAELGNLSLGRWIHSHFIEKGLIMTCQFGTALVDMYAKCGNVGYACKVFDRMPVRNVWTWSAMIIGFAQHGSAREALQMFSKMRESPVRPNDVTFLGVLCACSHAGLVDDGYRYFAEMVHMCKIKPRKIHYSVMVDILGRAGLLEEAYTFITNLPVEPDASVWRTLLSACSVHGIHRNSEGVEEKVRKKLLELEPKRGGNFIMVANMFAAAGMWEKAANVRQVMRGGRLKKIGGESCVEVGGSVSRFFCNDCPAACDAIYELLDRLSLHMKTTS